MDRRHFLKGGALLASALCVDFKSLAAATAGTAEKPRLTIGVLSDIHVRTDDDLPILEKAFLHFRDKGVDGVIIAGDMADTGLERQMKQVAGTWFKVFPKDKLPNGNHVERLFVYGNHDIDGQDYGAMDKFLTKEEQAAARKTELIADHRESYWKKYFHETYEQIYIKDVKGYKFVGAQWYGWNGTPGIQEFLDKHRPQLVGNKPFFFFQHPHPKNTCSGPAAWGRDNGESTKALSDYPNCVAFSGHSHHNLQDERTIWQGAFTSVGTSSLSYTCGLGGRENVEEVYDTQMPIADETDGKQGLLMQVYGDRITLERIDFVYGLPLGDNWVIPLTGEKPLTFDHRAAQAVAPQFASNDKVTVSRATGKSRKGTEQMQTTVHFPNVLKKRNGIRAYDFEVTLEMRDFDTIKPFCCKRVYSPHYYLGEAKDEGEVVCVFGEADVPKGRDFRFAVRPCECFGKKGNPIYSDWMNLE